ncbi:hypothetical protein GGF46_003341 [Coemansia sp. RSA 552]|nr:hypothetical protein GGF46_003341 [Coemansia sp. RSA 552]
MDPMDLDSPRTAPFTPPRSVDSTPLRRRATDSAAPESPGLHATPLGLDDDGDHDEDLVRLPGVTDEGSKIEHSSFFNNFGNDWCDLS